MLSAQQYFRNSIKRAANSLNFQKKKKNGKIDRKKAYHLNGEIPQSGQCHPMKPCINRSQLIV